MKPAEPLTRTFCIFTDLFLPYTLPVGPDLLRGQPRPESEPIPPQVAGYPLGHSEVRHARLPVKPDGGDLRDRHPHPAGLGGELDADLESVPRVDADRADEL